MVSRLAENAESWGRARRALLAQNVGPARASLRLGREEERAFAGFAGEIDAMGGMERLQQQLPCVGRDLARDAVAAYRRLVRAQEELHAVRHHRGWGRSRIDRWPFEQAVAKAKEDMEYLKSRLAAAMSVAFPGLASSYEAEGLESMVP